MHWNVWQCMTVKLEIKDKSNHTQVTAVPQPRKILVAKSQAWKEIILPSATIWHPFLAWDGYRYDTTARNRGPGSCRCAVASPPRVPNPVGQHLLLPPKAGAQQLPRVRHGRHSITSQAVEYHWWHWNLWQCMAVKIDKSHRNDSSATTKKKS